MSPPPLGLARRWCFAALLFEIEALRPRMNVLHIVTDDMRPELGLYNSPVLTPHLDALAKRSMVFQNAYCQQPVCSPSRNSFMTSLRPDTTKVWNFINYFRQSRPNATSFPQYFKQQPDTLALGAGKLYHTSIPPDHDEPASWSAEANGSHSYFEPLWLRCPLKDATFCVDDARCEKEDVRTVEKTIEHLRRAKREGKHFYVGCGFHRPHAPYVVPQRFHDVYAGPIETAQHLTMPEDVPDIACVMNFGVRYPNGTGPFEWDPKTKPIPVPVQADVRRHYFAAISYVDSLVGQLLQALKELELTESTIVIFHSDHGYFMGESGEWEKKMLFENTARVPLIIHDPMNPQHRRSEDMVELIDVYPTAAALSGLPVPAGLDGRDLSALFEQPAGRVVSAAGVGAAAFSQYPRCPPNASLHGVPRRMCFPLPASTFSYMGFSARTAHWRYTEWRRWDGGKLRAVWGRAGLVASELYNHTGHFADSVHTFDYEQRNLAAGSGRQKFAREIAALSALLRAQFDKEGDESVYTV